MREAGMTHEEFFARRTRVVEDGRWTDLISEYADDAVVHQPFARPEPVTLRGRDEIARHLAMGAALPITFAVKNVTVHETGDPEVFIAEYDYEVHVTTTGRTATVANIQLFRVRDGLIVESHDYHNHVALGALLAG
jgi:ketosteroid isomerase-like protein